MSYRLHYDSKGDLVGWTDANGRKVSYAFDGKGRPASVRSPDEELAFSYDANGNLTQVKQKTGVAAYRYDAFDRLAEAEYAFSPERRVSYEYDPLGRVSAVRILGTESPEYEVRYEYDILGNLLAVDDGIGRIEYDYYPYERRVARRLPNGITTTFTFSPLGELVSILHADSRGRLIARYDYEHDAAGNVIRVREEMPDAVKTFEYEWDNRGYLSALHLPDGSVERYLYDAMGNRTAKSGSSGMISYEYDKYGRLTRAGRDTYEYDRAGNLTSAVENGMRTRFKWDARGRLLEGRSPRGAVRYSYDAVGNLVSRMEKGETTHFLPNPLAPVGFTLAELDLSGRMKAAYLYGDTLLGYRTGKGQVRYFLEDGFSSIRAIVDAGARVVGRRDYSPFGEITRRWGEGARGFRTTCEMQGPSSNIFLIQSRAYDARAGRYITPDSSAAFAERPDSLNRYAHACGGRAGFASPRCHQTHQNGTDGAPLDLRDRMNEKRSHFGNALVLGMGQGTATIPEMVDKWGGHFQLIVTTSTDNSLLDAWVYGTNNAGGGPLGDLKWVSADPVYRHSGGGTIPFGGVSKTVLLDPAFRVGDTKGVGHVSDLTSWQVKPLGESGAAISFTPGGFGRLLRGVAGVCGDLLRGQGPLAQHALDHQFPLAGGLPERKYNEVWVYDMDQGEWRYYKQEGGEWNLGWLGKQMPSGDFRKRDEELPLPATVPDIQLDDRDDKRRYRPKGPDWPDGHDGGGGGGGTSNPFQSGGSFDNPLKSVQEDVGGVEMRASGKFVGNLGRITGLVYDRKTDRLVLVGDGDLSLPPLDLSYFAVAEELVSRGHDSVWFSLDPLDKKNPHGPWLKCVWGPEGLPADLLPGTPAGGVMFEADWLLKQYTFGVQVGEDGKVRPRICRVPGFKDIFTLGFEGFSATLRETWNRFWIVIGDVIIRRSGSALVIDDVNVQVMTERMYNLKGKGLQSSGGVKDPDAEAFAAFFQKHYDEFAQESPAFASLKEFGKVFGLVKWLHSQGIRINVDAQWLKSGDGQYADRVTALTSQQERKKKYQQGSATITETRIIHLFGGDRIETSLREIQDDGRAEDLLAAAGKALQGGASRPDVAIGQSAGVVLPFTSSGRRLWEKAKSRDTIKQHGITYHLGRDRKVAYAEDSLGNRVDYTRDNGGNLTGFRAKTPDGWNAALSASAAATTMDVRSPRGDSFIYRWDANGYLSEARVNGESFLNCSYDPIRRSATIRYQGYVQTLAYDDADRLQTLEIKPADDRVGGTRGAVTLAYDSNSNLSRLSTDAAGTINAHYQNGLIRSARTPAGRVEYDWLDGQRLAAVRANGVAVNYRYSGNSLRSVWVSRGGASAYATFENGLPDEAMNLSGGTWSYGYDVHGALAEVNDPTGARGVYRCDSAGRLVEVRQPDGGKLVYAYEQIKDGRGKNPSAEGRARLACVTFVPAGQEASAAGGVRAQEAFPWRTAGLGAAAAVGVLGGLWLYRRRQEMYW